MNFSQLSLLNILFLVTTAGALFAFYSSQQRNRQMAAAHETIKAGMSAEIEALEFEIKAREAEGIKLREEFGFLTIGDRSKIHAIAVPFVQQSKTWIYRIYLPEGNDYYAACKINDLPLGSEKPEHDFNTPGTSTVAGGYNSCGIGLLSGEYLITVSVFKDDNEYRYTLTCKATKGSRNSGGGSLIADAKDKWPTKSDSFSTSGVGQTMTIAPRDAPLILLNGRSFGMKVNSSDKSTEGILLWIEMVPSAAE